VDGALVGAGSLCWKLSVLSYYEHFFPHESCQTLSPDVPLKIWDDYL
jgi:hypothetical protein